MQLGSVLKVIEGVARKSCEGLIRPVHLAEMSILFAAIWTHIVPDQFGGVHRGQTDCIRHQIARGKPPAVSNWSSLVLLNFK